MTQSNTGSNAATVATAGTGKISTSGPNPGDTLCLDLDGSGGASGLVYFRDNIGSTVTAYAWSDWFQLVSGPASNLTVVRLRNVSAGQLDLAVTNANKLRVEQAGVPLFTPAAALTVGTWYFYRCYIVQSASVGQVWFDYYTWAGGIFTLVEDSTLLTNKNTGSLAYDNKIMGAKPVTTTTALRFKTGGKRYVDPAPSGLIPLPTIAGPPIAYAGPDQSISTGAPFTLDGRGSTTPTGTNTYAWSQTGGTTTPLSSTTVAQPTGTAPGTPGTLTYGLVVDNGVLTSTQDTVDIVVSAPGSSVVTSVLSGADGDTATAANTASAGGTAPTVTSGTIKISTVQPSPGDTRCLIYDADGTSGLNFTRDNFTPTDFFAMSFWHKFGSLPASNLQTRRLRTGNTGQLDITTLSDG
jgi:hypothetical protein